MNERGALITEWETQWGKDNQCMMRRLMKTSSPSMMERRLPMGDYWKMICSI
jgi:hypothetical protein